MRCFYLLLIAVSVIGVLGYDYGDPWGNPHTFGKPVFIVLIAIHGQGAGAESLPSRAARLAASAASRRVPIAACRAAA